MNIHRVVIGIIFNKKIFRLESLRGIVIDEVLNLRDGKKFGEKYFNKIGTSKELSNDSYVSFASDDDTNQLVIRTDQIVFKRTALEQGSVNIDTTIDEFEELWKCTDKILKYPQSRRIGIVQECRIKENNEKSAAKDLISTLLKISISSNNSGLFELKFDSLGDNPKGERPNINLDDFWRTAYSIYLSEKDETPKDGYINTNIDVQKYYNFSGPLCQDSKLRK